DHPQAHRRPRPGGRTPGRPDRPLRRGGRVAGDFRSLINVRLSRRGLDCATLARCPQVGASAMRVLFVEDIEMNRRVVKEMLRAGGIEMAEAEDGAAGLAMI